jgi:hypothetical protein
MRRESVGEMRNGGIIGIDGTIVGARTGVTTAVT